MSDTPDRDRPDTARPSVLIHLDNPTDGQVVPRYPLLVAGWALDPEGPLVAVLVGVDRERWTGALMGLRRPDVAEAYPDAPVSGRSGWRVELDLREWPKESVEISIVALREDRTWWIEIPAVVRLRSHTGRGF
jgi:hypothetical protein